MKKLILALACLMLCIGRLGAVVTADGIDHTNRPPGNMGIIYDRMLTIVSENGGLDTPAFKVGPRDGGYCSHDPYFGVGRKVKDNIGEIYTVTHVYPQPTGDVTFFKVTPDWATNSGWFKIWDKPITAGMKYATAGFGPAPGPKIFKAKAGLAPIWISGLTVSNQVVKLSVACTNTATYTFKVQQTADLNSGNWTTLSNSFSATQNVCKISIPCGNAGAMFYRLIPTSLVTNQVWVGNKLGIDLRRSWGMGSIWYMDGDDAVCSYEKDGSCNTYCDSGFADLALDPEDNEWKVFAVNSQSFCGPYSTDGGLTWDRSTVFDLSGVMMGKQEVSGEITPTIQYPEDYGYGQRVILSIIDPAWATGVINNGQ
ncbi:hypothetical protein A2738_01945 [Candidatus Nomurabacteria bacterium RIFCSPHIGHO2_01_FULL_42_15]|uniref:Exo-alpha-sialidase n=1 Tax=Candidatus Nomurabacteria bacterium RIFCSPHIGHO2_01_FULL_42_15 TaxID=1801742 RepID=A0A1F6VF53_9BACT|nr:MAG: hypothetical protein A2738_01945 [Candidatus Nomurabacteria bacterium RIFCSPHIGHO2_01_FULL_42_15]OGI93370.1 MAG: hypothetical protein A3A99_01675 [Candidatus Nomurabacteria bacterium RIFCSPLOWO2_01_FULL_41_18]